MTDLITVIINVYNGEKYIKKCLDCVINQTYKKLEILIINDGSTDNTFSIIKKYNDKRIRVITTKNMGLSLSRNIGIENAKGKYIYFIDVDDLIEYDTIEYLYKLLKKYNTLMATCEAKIVSNRISNSDIREKVCVKTSIEMLKKVLLSNNRHGAIWNKLIDKKLFSNLLFEDRIVNDIVLVYKLFMKVDGTVYSNKQKYFYVKNNNSITSRRDTDRAIDQYYAVIERYDYIEKIYPNMLENKIAVMLCIVDVYNHNNIVTDDFIEKNDINKKYKSFFSLRIMLTKLSFKNMVKLILYRINPKVERFFQKMIKRY